MTDNYNVVVVGARVTEMVKSALHREAEEISRSAQSAVDAEYYD